MNSLRVPQIKDNREREYSHIQYSFWKTLLGLFKFTFRDLIMIVQILYYIPLIAFFIIIFLVFLLI